MDWLEIAKLSVIGFLFGITLYFIFAKHLPKIMEQQTEANKLFKESLDTITVRHENGMKEISESMTQISSDLAGVREVVAGCKFRSEQK